MILFISLSTSNCVSNQKSVDVCRCLTEPVNTEWNYENSDDCKTAISKEIGVENWETINMSQNLSVSAKWDALVKRCQ